VSYRPQIDTKYEITEDEWTEILSHCGNGGKPVAPIDRIVPLAQMQAALYYLRRNRRGRVAVQALTPLESGVSKSSGAYVQSFGSAFVAITSGTTGATAPRGTGSTVNDGGVMWQYVFPASLPGISS
jgi:hypothetical protein